MPPRNEVSDDRASRLVVDRLSVDWRFALGAGGSWYAEYPNCMFAFSWMLRRDEAVFFRMPGGGASLVLGESEPFCGKGEEGRGMEVAKGTNVGLQGIPSSFSPTKHAVTYIISPIIFKMGLLVDAENTFL